MEVVRFPSFSCDKRQPRSLRCNARSGDNHARSRPEKPQRVAAEYPLPVDFRQGLDYRHRAPAFGISDVKRIIAAEYDSLRSHAVNYELIACGVESASVIIEI